VHKATYWEHALEDILDVVAKMPEIAAIIYRCTFKDGVVNKDTSGKLDYVRIYYYSYMWAYMYI
jgi:citrate synthase